MNKQIAEMKEVVKQQLSRLRNEMMVHGFNEFDELTETALETLSESIETIDKILNTVRSMRNAQQCWDTVGAGKYLQDKVRLEKQVDELLAEVVKPDEVFERIPDGTEVYLELGFGSSKSEFVDAIIVGYSEGKPCVQTSWGAVYNLIDPKRVQRREVSHA